MAERDNLGEKIREKEKELHQAVMRKGELTRQMADEIIDKVIVSEDGVTVLFREGL